MKAVLLKTGSFSGQKINRSKSGLLPTTPQHQNSTVSFRFENGFSSIRRSISDSDMNRSEMSFRFSRSGSVSFEDMSAIIEDDIEVDLFTGWTGNGMGIGKGKGNGFNCSGNSENYDEKKKIGEYYRQMLKVNPRDSLLLRNYAKYLHEVEKNGEKAKEYYGRAILANPGDGEVLCLYGKLIWETEKDEVRANSYFDQAVRASPHDCMVLGSYASFLWEVSDDQDEQTKQANVDIHVPPMVGAY